MRAFAGANQAIPMRPLVIHCLVVRDSPASIAA
jgi:hypothetical protein